MELKNKDNFFGRQMQYKWKILLKNPLDMQQATKNSSVNIKLVRKLKWSDRHLKYLQV